MAILSKIRERSVFLIFIIALGLFAFLVQPDQIIELFSNGGAKDYTLKVDGETVSGQEFGALVEAAQRPGQSSLQVATQVYDQKVTEIVMNKEFDKLGISIEKDQMWALIKQQFQNHPEAKNEAGQFDEGLLKAYIESQVEISPRGWDNVEKRIAFNGKQQLYYALIQSATLPTEKEGEIAYKMQNDLVDLKFVYLPYTAIVDSTIVITNEKVNNYVKAHANKFKQDPSAAVEYVYFEEKASKEDEEKIKLEINELLPTFNAATNAVDFVLDNSDTALDTVYKLKTALDKDVQAVVDSLKVGETFGPYSVGNLTKLAKLLGTKKEASVKASHALIAYVGATRANPDVTRTKEEAQALANDLLVIAKTSGNDFAAFATKNSDGPSATKGGDLGWFYEGQMVPEFNDFVFSNKPGNIGLVETDFGFHIINVVDTKEEDKFQFATVAKKIIATQKTINDLYTEATQFEVDANASSFTEAAKAKDYAVRPVNKVAQLSENLPGLEGTQRSIVKWMFDSETNKGDVKRFDVNGNHVVVRLTGRNEERLSNAQEASFTVLPILRNEQKAKQLSENISGTTLAEIAKGQNVQVRTASAVSMGSPLLPGVGNEPKVVGTAFALESGQVSKVIEGVKGIFVLELVKHTDAPIMDSYKIFAKDPANNINAVGGKVVEALKGKSEIEDNRATFY